MPDALDAREQIAKGIRYEIAQNPPPLTGKPSVARYEAIAKYMRGFDLVLTYNWGAIDGVMARRVFSQGTPPVIHHEDGFNSDEATRLKPTRNMYRRMALTAAHALVVPSHRLEAVAARIWKQPPERVHRIANGVATRRYAGKPVADALPGFRRAPDDIVIGTIAGLRPVKDLPLLLRAVAGIIADVRLVIVGEGPERDAIARTADLLDIDLTMPGFVAEPHRYIGLFDIFALSSQSEQAPISVIEAMAAGLPVVSPPVGDVPAMIASENRTYLSPDRHEVHLRDRLQVLANNPQLRADIGRANQMRAREAFDESKMIAAYARLYSEAAGRPGCLDQG